MVRTRRPLVERMALVWHDWFATSNVAVGSQRLMLIQNGLFRRRGLGSFADLLQWVTRDPAMLVWLSGNVNTKDAPNENYARELMELFTLGADRPGGGRPGSPGETDGAPRARPLCLVVLDSRPPRPRHARRPRRPRSLRRSIRGVG
jgi:uncharacterized protein (DUF1800 family)